MSERATTIQIATERPAARWRAGDVVALLAVVAIALLIRLWNVDSAPSADELWHLALSTGNGSPVGRFEANGIYVDVPPMTDLAHARPAWQIWSGMDRVLHPPLYVLTLRLWRDVFGASDMAAHAYSIAWSLIAVGFVFAAARLAMDRAAAVFCAMILAVAPVQIYFAQEIRGYAMLVGLAAIATWIAARIEVLGATRRRAASLAAMTLPLVLTHYFAAGAAAGIAAYGLARLRGAERRAFAGALVIAAAIYTATWVPFAWRQIGTLASGDDLARVDRFSISGEAWWLTATAARVLVDGFWLDDPRRAWPALAVGGACLVMPWLVARRLPSLRPWAAMLAGAVLAIGALDAIRTTWLTQMIRYLAVASPVAPLLIVGIAFAIRRRAGYVVGSLAIVALLAIPRGPRAVVADSPDVSGLATWARANVPAGDAILVVGGTGWADQLADLTLLTLSHEPGVFPRTVSKLTRPPSRDLLNALPETGWAFFPGVARLPADPIFAGVPLLSVVNVTGLGLVARYDLGGATADGATQPTR